MNKVLEFVMYYLIYLVPGFLGVWLGSLFIGVDINPFTNWIPYVVALVMSVYEVTISN
ncbi:nuclease [Staphylococcus phage PG-2021_35]